MKGFINLKELKLESNQMGAIIGGAADGISELKETTRMVRTLYGIIQAARPLYGIIQPARPLYGIAIPRE
ncbi:MAG: hypothetical protein JXR70_08425 [Spirochaetales bacterium]|nr:hypothetical protein [Spirochaetales bacterium]